MKHDDGWLRDFIVGLPIEPKNSQIADVARGYCNHMSRFIPASEWHEDDGAVLWYRLPVSEPPYVGTPLDTGWETEPVHILANGETNAEYYTHFQHIHVPEH